MAAHAIGELAARFAADESGATAVEYALLVSLIAAVIAATVAALGGKVLALFQAGVAIFP